MSKSIACIVGLCLVALIATPALAGVVLSNPALPPTDGDPLLGYLGEMHAMYPGGIDMSDPFHSRFANIVRTPLGPDEIEDFDSTLTAMVDAGAGPVPVTLTGPVTTLVYGKTGNTTGTFDTEIIAMSLTGSVGGVPIIIRESPLQPSQGRTTITDLGGGLWEIDSFFDVFTELSVGGGPFQPQTNGPSRMVLVRLPEPATLSLLGLGGLALLRRRRVG